MALPTKAEVSVRVKGFIEAFSDSDEVDEDNVLAEAPLSMDATALGYLATTLRQYVKFHNDKVTILVGEVRKSGLTVLGLIDLVFKRIKS